MCSSNPRITSLAISALRRLCFEIARVEGSDMADRYSSFSVLLNSNDVYGEFLNFEANNDSVLVGRVAYQKRYRKMLRQLSYASPGMTMAWEEGSRRWASFFRSQTKKTDDTSKPKRLEDVAVVSCNFVLLMTDSNCYLSRQQ